ncbi:chemoreceptor glutamine deamidase CheD [Thalassomonas actiniarum]|uniref:chemoreceptor glutamine deamidase CheD n=1 Tax=Thalassomonas actiniarum TaxID=485447 RepID=UPI0022A9A922|nr:chemoreceptor glutamine deamidase CheD [Thalassomonas actiniarum]
MVASVVKVEVEECLHKCLPEFTHINHYWDRQRQMVVAKILPGEFYITTENIAIATTLGSCIAACIRDTRTGMGGMNHFMLPHTLKEAAEVNWGQRKRICDATRYGNYAMEHLINKILSHGGRRCNFRAKVFGGGKVLKQMSDVGQSNIDFVLGYLKDENIRIDNADLGGDYPRKVIFEPGTGKVYMKRLDNLHNDTIVRRERDYKYKIDHQAVGGDIELF